MSSKRRHEGYLMVDHRAVCVPKHDLPVTNGALVQGGTLFESAIVHCSHCQRGVVLRPDRSRERGYCPKCDHYVCDACEAVRVASGGACRTFKQIADEVYEAAVRAEQGRTSAILGPDGNPVLIAPSE